MRSELTKITWREVNGKKAMELPDGILAIQDEKDPFLFIDNDNNKYRIDPTPEIEEEGIDINSFNSGIDYDSERKAYDEVRSIIDEEAKDLSYQVDRHSRSTSVNTWDLLRKNVKPFSGIINCDFCYSKKNVEYLDIASGNVDWFATGQFMQQLLDIKIHFICSDCAVKLQNKFRQVTKEFVEKEKRPGMFENQGVTDEERTALTTGFFGVGKKV